MHKLKNCIRNAASAGLVLAASCASAAAVAPVATPTIHDNVIEGVRNARYCEIIPIVRDGLHLTATVYNTLGLNECPAKVWDSISEDAMKQRFDAVTVLLNGPRYFLMDSIEASGATEAGKKIDDSSSLSAPPSMWGFSICCTGPTASRPSTATQSTVSKLGCQCS
jgi:hypothetical protein